MEANIRIRVAWYDKKINKYDYGNWHSFGELNKKNLWVKEQNKNFPFVRYWVEGFIVSNENIGENIGENIETFNVIKIESQKENEFLLI